jgi:hypothetical protein
MNDINAELQRLLALRMLEVLKDGREVIGPGGEPRRIMATAADFNAIRGLLKDNGVTSVQTADSPLNDLVQEMSKRGLKFRPSDIANDEEAA